MKLTTIAVLLGMGAGLGTTTVAHGETVSFDYTARVATTYTNNVGTNGIGFDNTTVQAGNTVRGTFTIDLATDQYFYHGPDPTPGYASYNMAGALNTASIVVDQTGYTFAAVPARHYESGYQVSDGVRDEFDFRAVNFNANDYGARAVTIHLIDTDGANFASVARPTSLSLDGWDTATVSFSFSQDQPYGYYSFDATLTSLVPHATSPVPEPATLTMYGLGLLTIGALARRRRP